MFGIVAWILLVLIFFVIGFRLARLLGWSRKSILKYLVNFLGFLFLMGLEVAFGYLPVVKDSHYILRIVAHIFPLIALWFGSKLCVIGLTGGIACGKSTLSNLLAE